MAKDTKSSLQATEEWEQVASSARIDPTPVTVGTSYVGVYDGPKSLGNRKFHAFVDDSGKPFYLAGRSLAKLLATRQGKRLKLVCTSLGDGARANPQFTLFTAK